MLKNKEHGAKRFRTVLGGIAQLARVLGSYPIGHWFESSCRYQIRSRLNTNTKYIFVNGVAGAIFERQ